METEQPKASFEPQAEAKAESRSTEVADKHKEEEAANAEAASSAPGVAQNEDEEEESTVSPTSTCSWHGTPTWNDMTTFSQVQHLPLNFFQDSLLPTKQRHLQW